VLNTPRFRALALFGRRPHQRVDGLGTPASENLHKTSHNGRVETVRPKRYSSQNCDPEVPKSCQLSSPLVLRAGTQ